MRMTNLNFSELVRCQNPYRCRAVQSPIVDPHFDCPVLSFLKREVFFTEDIHLDSLVQNDYHPIITIEQHPPRLCRFRPVKRTPAGYSFLGASS